MSFSDFGLKDNWRVIDTDDGFIYASSVLSVGISCLAFWQLVLGVLNADVDFIFMPLLYT